MTTIGIINAAGSALSLALQRLGTDLPGAEAWALLDDRLLADLARGADPASRLKDMAVTLESGGVDAIWITCSSFPATVEEIRRASRIPVTGPDELMFDALGEEQLDHLTIVYSAEPARPAVEHHLRRTRLDSSARVDWVKWASAPSDGPLDESGTAAVGASVAAGTQRIVLAQYSLEALAAPLESRFGIPVVWGLPYAIDLLRPALEKKREIE